MEQKNEKILQNNLKALRNLEDFLALNELEDDYMTSILYQVHEDLRLVRKWTNLRVVKNESCHYLAGMAPAAFDSVFPSHATDRHSDRTQVVVPVPAHQILSPLKLQALCRQCTHPQTGAKLRCITTAIVDDDSTTAYYRIFDSFAEITHPQWKQKVKRKGDDEVNGTHERSEQKVNGEKSDSEEVDSDSD